jgi:hypothetical protein
MLLDSIAYKIKPAYVGWSRFRQESQGCRNVVLLLRTHRSKQLAAAIKHCPGFDSQIESSERLGVSTYIFMQRHSKKGMHHVQWAAAGANRRPLAAASLSQRITR